MRHARKRSTLKDRLDALPEAAKKVAAILRKRPEIRDLDEGQPLPGIDWRIEVNKAGTKASAEGTLATATALNEAIGYDLGTRIVQIASKTGRPLRDVAHEEGVDAKLYDDTIDLRRIAAGNQA